MRAGSIDRKAQILDEATRLFSESGYDKVTIKQGKVFDVDMFAMELNHVDFDSKSCVTLRTGIMAGAPCPPEGGKPSQIKVRVESPCTDDCASHSIRFDTTTVEIHVVNQPFIYESVRGYFAKKGYRIIGSVN